MAGAVAPAGAGAPNGSEPVDGVVTGALVGGTTVPVGAPEGIGVGEGAPTFVSGVPGGGGGGGGAIISEELTGACAVVDAWLRSGGIFPCSSCV